MASRPPTQADLFRESVINELACNAVNFKSTYALMGGGVALSFFSGLWWLAPIGVTIAGLDAANQTKSTMKKIREVKNDPDAWIKYAGVPKERLLASHLDVPLEVLDAQILSEGAIAPYPATAIAQQPADPDTEGEARIYHPHVLEQVAANLTKHLLLIGPTQSGKSTFLKQFIGLIQKFRRPQRIVYCSTKINDTIPYGVEGFLIRDAQGFYDFLQYMDRLLAERRKSAGDQAEEWYLVDEWESQIAAIEMDLEKDLYKRAIGIVGRFLSEASGLGLKLGLITQSGNLEELKLGSGGKAANLAVIALGSENSGYDFIRRPHRSFGTITKNTKAFIDQLAEGFWVFAPYKGEQILIPGMAPDPNQRLVALKDWSANLFPAKSNLLDRVRDSLDRFKGKAEAVVDRATDEPDLIDEYLSKVAPHAATLSDVVDRFGTRLERRGAIRNRRVSEVQAWLEDNNLPVPGEAAKKPNGVGTFPPDMAAIGATSAAGRNG